ncbi:hypothetical protein T10_7029 [Trichinella papuae]|uniref:Uncharacterized protein n=1 Tax=Trichinella papuae TaxID=268474 RepID=A0A0V1M517_9BILA|nr:hypothetical protein T10_7029 [Trichinella papuae]
MIGPAKMGMSKLTNVVAFLHFGLDFLSQGSFFLISTKKHKLGAIVVSAVCMHRAAFPHLAQRRISEAKRLFSSFQKYLRMPSPDVHTLMRSLSDAQHFWI